MPTDKTDPPGDPARATPPRPVQGVDYYLENGCWVFTAAYHLKRGRCCESDCRHCPYGKEKTTEPTPASAKPDSAP